MGKKRLFVFALIMIFAIGMISAESLNERKTSHKKIELFMADYYSAYNNYAQDMETMDLMDDYWAPEFIVTIFFPVPQYPTMNLEYWKRFLVMAHLQAKERLVSEGLAIDTKKMTVTSELFVGFYDRNSDELLYQVDGVGIYKLKADTEGKLYITGLKLFFSDPNGLMEFSTPPAAN